MLIFYCINNDINGLYDYLSAANIRCKVKNPLFLISKFYNVCALYYNKNLINRENPRTIFEIHLKTRTINNLFKDLIFF